jgi:pyrroline-5-carboxylate reductase
VTVDILGDSRWVIIGAGNVGSILLERLRSAGVPADHILVSEEEAGRCERVSTRFGVRAARLGDGSMGAADVFLLATPPGAVLQALNALKARLRPGQAVISFAAAVSLARLEAAVPPGVAVVRVMPNAPSLIGEGMNPVVYGGSVEPRVRERVETLLAELGRSVGVRDDQMNWCVGLTGAAMRTLLPALEGMTRAGMEADLSPADARTVAAQAMRGTASLVLQTDLTFEQLKGLTPMETVDEAALTQVLQDAARSAMEKTHRLQAKLEAG